MTDPSPAPGPQLPQLRPPQTMPDSFYDTYCAAARMRLSSREHARIWWALGVPVETAGAWARAGFTPAEGWRQMNDDRTPQDALRTAEKGNPT
jgi:hypothetical protein